MYKILRNILFLLEAESVHYFSMNVLKLLCRISFIREILSRQYAPVNKELTVLGLTFRNNVGLAAGFDKNAKYLDELKTLGFGFVEIGTVTPLPQKGNGKPRLFRLRKDKALINRMGFNNDGVVAVAARLKAWRDKQLLYVSEESKQSRMIIGGNLGKNKSTPNEEAWKDYQVCFLELFDHVDYFVVNVSSPNTPGLRELQEKESLRKILGTLQTINLSKSYPKPLLFKIAPDLNTDQIDDLIELAIELKLAGIVATNTTLSRDHLATKPFDVESMGTGGVSGLPLKNKATELIQYIHNKAGERLLVIGSGGIFNYQDAKEKTDAGATLVQVWTGFIYVGPIIIKDICGH